MIKKKIAEAIFFFFYYTLELFSNLAIFSCIA
nr:MAG TPA: hypothetical protein [Caudoviricetes sp.]